VDCHGGQAGGFSELSETMASVLSKMTFFGSVLTFLSSKRLKNMTSWKLQLLVEAMPKKSQNKRTRESTSTDAEEESKVVYHLHGQTALFTVWVGLGKW